MQAQEIISLIQPEQSSFSGLALQNLTNQNTPTLSPNSHQSSFPNMVIKPEMKSQTKEYKGSNMSHLNNQENIQNTSSTILQQENNILKNQIEVLKSALIGLCKDQNTSLSQPLNPLLQQFKENKNIELELTQFILQLQQSQQQLQTQQQVSPNKNSSPKKSSQPKQSKDSFVFQPYSENIKESPTSRNHQFSSQKKSQVSSTRRRRCDRVINTPQNQNLSMIAHLQAMNIIESKFSVTPTSINSRCIQEIAPIQIYNDDSQLRINTVEDQHTSRVTEYELQDSKINQTSTILIEEGEEADVEQKLHKDASQLQLKYAKMLEELETQSVEKVKIQCKINENDLTQQEQSLKMDALEVDFTPLKQQFGEVYKSNQLDSISNQNLKKRSFSSGQSRTFHLKNKKSFQFEQKQFYEQELNTLKNELEQFAKEEEKLLSILEYSKQDPPTLKQSRDFQNSSISVRSSSPDLNKKISIKQNPEDEKRQRQAILEQSKIQVDTTKTPIKLIDHNRQCSFSQVDFDNEGLNIILEQEAHMTDEDQNQSSFQVVDRPATLSQQELLQNLAEASQYILEQKVQEDQLFIKPVKIESPIHQNNLDDKQVFALNEEDQQQQLRITQVLPDRVTTVPPKISEIRNKTPKVQRKQVTSSITPIRAQLNTTSADRLLKRIQYEKQKDQLKQNDSQQQSQRCQQIQTQPSINHSKKSSTISNAPLSTNTRKQKGFISQQKTRPPVSQYIPHASKSQKKNGQDFIDAQNGKSPQRFSIYQIFKTMSNNASPLKQIMKSERRYKECGTLENEEEYSQYLEENSNREQKLLTLEQLSKRQSLARGLRQQEEPSSEGEECLRKIQEHQEDMPQYDCELSADNQEMEEIVDKDLFNSGNYYGVYSKEKSELLKNQRNESIKKAEELLSQFIVSKSSRPRFMHQANKPLQQLKLSFNQQQQLSEEESVDEQLQQKQENYEQTQQKYISDSYKVIDVEYKTFIVENQNCKILEEEDADFRESHHLFDDGVLDQKQSQVFANVSALDEAAQIRMDNNMNEISFQNNQSELCQVTFVRHHDNSKQNSYQHSRSNSSSMQQSTVNIEIPALMRSPQKSQVDQQTKNGGGDMSQDKKQRTSFIGIKKEFEQTQNQLVSRQYEGFKDQIINDDYSDYTQECDKQQPTPSKRLSGVTSSDYQQKRNQMNQRRKSHEVCKLKMGTFSQQKKSTLMKKKRMEQISPMGCQNQGAFPPSILNQTSSHTAFQKFNLGANPGSSDKSSKHNYFGGAVGTKSQYIQQQQQQDGSQCYRGDYTYLIPQQQQYFNNTYIDPELLYEKRSKSVIKRREELQKKKDQDNRTKIEAKYQKIDSLRQTRNQRLLGGTYQNNRSLNQHSSKMNVINKQDTTSNKVCCDQQSSSSYINCNEANNIDAQCVEFIGIMKGETASDGVNYTSNKDKKESLFGESRSTITKCMMNQSTIYSNINEQDDEFQNNPKSISLQPQQQVEKQDEIIGQRLSKQNTHSNPSKIISECSSFRQNTHFKKRNCITDQSDQKDIQEFQMTGQVNAKQGQPKTPTCNLAYKKQQSALKQNIINRTVRMGGAQSNQKHTSKLSNYNNDLGQVLLKKMQSTLEISAYQDNQYGYPEKCCIDKNSTLNSTLHASTSFIINQNSTCSQQNDNSMNKLCASNKSTTINKKNIEYIQYQKQKDSTHFINSSRSNKKGSLQNNNIDSVYNYCKGKQPITYNAPSNPTIVITRQDQQIGVNVQQSACFNCQRLLSKGLSTDFCLQHMTNPKYVKQ